MTDKVKVIGYLSKKHSIKLLCKVLRVPRSTYYATISRKPSKHSIENAQLKQSIMEIYEKSGQRYGCIKIRHELGKQGYHISQNRVLRLMYILKDERSLNQVDRMQKVP